MGHWARQVKNRDTEPEKAMWPGTASTVPIAENFSYPPPISNKGKQKIILLRNTNFQAWDGMGWEQSVSIIIIIIIIFIKRKKPVFGGNSIYLSVYFFVV